MINNKVNVRQLGRRAPKANVPHIKVDIRLPLIKYIKKCVNDLRIEKHITVDNVIIGQLRNNTPVLTEEAGCFYACLNKKLGFVRADGSYDIGVLENLPQKQNNSTDYKRMVNMARECQSLSSNDECKMALCFYQEMLKIQQ